VPDIYQGCEWWNLSLVDPDNRRPVDFETRRAALSAMQASTEGPRELAADLASHLEDGRLKQFVTWRALELRRRHETLFRDGGYVPLTVGGERADHACAFARVQGNDCAVAIASRLACTLLGAEMVLPVGEVWGDTYLDVSSLHASAAEDVLGGSRLRLEAGRIPLARLLDRLPVALLATGSV
jgi:(1->4)-alpha-D-glucan 1-alpha-D-glucosylmutase